MTTLRCLDLENHTVLIDLFAVLIKERDVGAYALYVVIHADLMGDEPLYFDEIHLELVDLRQAVHAVPIELRRATGAIDHFLRTRKNSGVSTRLKQQGAAAM